MLFRIQATESLSKRTRREDPPVQDDQPLIVLIDDSPPGTAQEPDRQQELTNEALLANVLEVKPRIKEAVLEGASTDELWAVLETRPDFEADVAANTKAIEDALRVRLTLEHNRRWAEREVEHEARWDEREAEYEAKWAARETEHRRTLIEREMVAASRRVELITELLPARPSELGAQSYSIGAAPTGGAASSSRAPYSIEAHTRVPPPSGSGR